jgi:hypothetical protein
MDKWNIVYVDEMPKDLKDGDYEDDFGFKVNKDFYIVSRMARGRYIDLVSYDLKLKISNGRKSQRWYFDKKTKTIRSRQTTSYSIQVQSSGNGKKMVITSTSSRWWQLFKFDGSTLRNMYDDRVIAVEDNKDVEGQ